MHECTIGLLGLTWIGLTFLKDFDEDILPEHPLGCKPILYFVFFQNGECVGCFIEWHYNGNA